MPFNDHFRVYDNRNLELRTLVKTLYEFGRTVSQSQSAAHTNGLDEHAMRRQRSYVDYAMAMLDSLNAKPIPDLPASHPTNYPIDLRTQYIYFLEDVSGNKVPLNESAQLLAEKWMIAAVELAMSNSAAMGGSLVNFDHERAVNNVETIGKLLDEIEARPFLDLPETAMPGSEYATRSTGTGSTARTGGTNR